MSKNTTDALCECGSVTVAECNDCCIPFSVQDDLNAARQALRGLFRAGQKQGWDHHYEHEMEAARAVLEKTDGRS